MAVLFLNGKVNISDMKLLLRTCFPFREPQGKAKVFVSEEKHGTWAHHTLIYALILDFVDFTTFLLTKYLENYKEVKS